MTPSRRLAPTVSATIKAAMTRRGMNAPAVAAALGVSPTIVRFWTSGRYLPSIEHAAALAELLHDDGIANRTREATFARCAYLPCSKPFNRHWKGRKREFCSDRCREKSWREPDARRDPRQDSIDAMCSSCEPEGICRTAECPLRAYSPLPFIPWRAA